jgi:ribosomal protein S18 acetylase RimI-like enzyme
MHFTIRPAVESDADQVAALSREFSFYLRDLGDPTDFRFSANRYRYDGFGSNPAFFGFVAESNADIIGYLLYHYGYDADTATRTMHVIDLYVSKKHRKCGAGSALMMHARQVCRKSDVREMVWSVYKSNYLAHAFFTRIGAKYTEDLDYMHLEVGV